METLAFHPEELFDKAARGLATADELARLDQHLVSCTTCRFERQVRADFDAVGGSAADLDDLVARALSGAAAVPEAPRRRRVGPLLIAASVALMGFGSFAAVAQFTGVLPRLFTQRTEDPAPVVRPPAPVRAAPVVAPEPVVEPEVAAPVESPPPAPAPLVVAERAPVAPRSSVPVREDPVEPTPDLPPAPVAEPDALAIFSRATQARVRGETGDAIRDFRVVVARFPGTREASLSHAALGRLLLDRGEAASALEAFDAYLGSNDQVLREDVQGARAMALQSLGRAAEERSAWESVLQDYPAGVYAPRARTRLESLAP